MKKTFVILSVFTFILLACNDSTTDESTNTSGSSITSTTSTDANSSATNNNVVTDEKSKEFLTKVANGGMAEVQMAKDAQQKATIGAVKVMQQCWKEITLQLVSR